MSVATARVAPDARRTAAPSPAGSGTRALLELARTAPDGPAWLATLRRLGAERFAAEGIPTSRHEEWRFTPVGPLAATPWRSAGPSPALAVSDITPFLFEECDWPRVVVVDGRVDAALSKLDRLPTGVTVSPLADAIAAGHPMVEAHLGKHATAEATPFTALNTALMTDGAFVHVAAGVTLDEPVHVLYVATRAADGAILAPRTLAVLERGARASVIESFVALDGGASFTDVCTEVVLAEQAWCEHTRIQREHESAWHIGFTQVDQQRDSHYRSFTLAMGGRLSRHNLHARLNAPAIETLLYGLYLTRGEQLADNHTAIFHDQPHCNSWEVYKGVLAERSRGVFNGKIFVQPEAQKTDAKQTNRSILLSEEAKVDTKPQLEIFADDVKCTHGATIGRLDEQQRYYLATRGIGGRTAQALLLWAFVAEVLIEVTHAPVRGALERLVKDQLDALIG